MAVPLMDLRAQYLELKEEIDRAILEVMDSSSFILGEKVKKFEEEVAAYLGVKCAVGVANGTDALILSLQALGVGPGDEVITTPYTFIATAEAISQVGATPVFVDISPKTYNIDPQKIEEYLETRNSKFETRPKAIIPVHLFGQSACLDPILEIAEKHNLKVIEDACQAIGEEYKGKKVGGLGDTGCFSFFPTKNLSGAGDGGMVVTNDEKIAEKVKSLRVHGSSKKYYHSLLGHNSRLDTLQAAILSIKLKKLDEWNEKRRKIASLYNELLADSGVITPYVMPNGKHVYHLYVIRVEDRDAVAKKLKEREIGCGVYYPLPLHLQEVYAGLGYNLGDLPESEKASLETLALPMYPHLTKAQVEEVTTALKEVIEGR